MARNIRGRMNSAEAKAVPNLYTACVKGAAVKEATIRAFPALKSIVRGDGRLHAKWQGHFGDLVLAITSAPSLGAFWKEFNALKK